MDGRLVDDCLGSTFCMRMCANIFVISVEKVISWSIRCVAQRFPDQSGIFLVAQYAIVNHDKPNSTLSAILCRCCLAESIQNSRGFFNNFFTASYMVPFHQILRVIV